MVKYNKTFTLKRATLSRDAGGATTKTWSTVTTFKGRIRKLSGTEQIEYGKKRVLSTHRLYTDYSAARFDDVIEYDDKIYNILMIDNPHLLDKFYEIDLELKI